MIENLFGEERNQLIFSRIPLRQALESTPLAAESALSAQELGRRACETTLFAAKSTLFDSESTLRPTEPVLAASGYFWSLADLFYTATESISTLAKGNPDHDGQT